VAGAAAGAAGALRDAVADRDDTPQTETQENDEK